MQKLRFRADRLLKLAAHLENGRPGGHKKFDFSKWHVNHGDENHCGTLGCAIGEMPVVFPKLARFGTIGHWLSGTIGAVKGRVKKRLSGFELASDVFGVAVKDCHLLFNPGGQRWWVPKQTSLSNRATAKQVARSIRLYVKARQELKSSERP